jgi:2-methylcitrate dehydratase
MVAVPLIFGRVSAADYEDSAAADPRIDVLRDRIFCVEEPASTCDYHDPDKRSIANAVTLELTGNRVLDEIVVEYPVGHRRRHMEGAPLLEAKFRRNLARRLSARQRQAILDASMDRVRLENMPVHEYVDLYTPVRE